MPKREGGFEAAVHDTVYHAADRSDNPLRANQPRKNRPRRPLG
jgi:hypothetical protein